jgi:hypothetical protein
MVQCSMNANPELQLTRAPVRLMESIQVQAEQGASFLVPNAKWTNRVPGRWLTQRGSIPSTPDSTPAKGSAASAQPSPTDWHALSARGQGA